MSDAVRTGSDEGRGEGGRDRDQTGEERGAFGTDALDPAVPADETDDRDDGGLPEQCRRLAGRRHPQESAPVQQDTEECGLQRGDAADGRRQQFRSERAQHRHGEHGEPDLTRERTHREQDSREVRTPPALDGEGPGRHEPGRVQDGAGRTASLQHRHEDAHDDGRAADENAWNRWFRRLFGGQHGQVEPDHADCREKSEPAPLASGEGTERSEAGASVSAQQRYEQECGQAIAQCLASGIRIVAQHAVGREGSSHEDTGKGCEEYPA